MRCHYCQQEITPDPYKSWQLEGRYMVIYRCENAHCSMHYVCDRIEMHVMFPDKQVITFSILFEMNNKRYRLFSDSAIPNRVNAKPLTQFFCLGHRAHSFTGGYPEEDRIFDIERFFTVSWEEDWEPQLKIIREKLRTLVLFS